MTAPVPPHSRMPCPPLQRAPGRPHARDWGGVPLTTQGTVSTHHELHMTSYGRPHGRDPIPSGWATHRDLKEGASIRPYDHSGWTSRSFLQGHLLTTLVSHLREGTPIHLHAPLRPPRRSPSSTLPGTLADLPVHPQLDHPDPLSGTLDGWVSSSPDHPLSGPP
jgi:hypothetical protein